jgi:hypothetical protein
MGRNGSLTGDGIYLFYSGGTTWNVDSEWPVNYSSLANGASLQLGGSPNNGYTANRLFLAYWQSNAFGTLTVQTQRANATWGTLATVSANNQGPLTLQGTNWFFNTQSNLIARVTSSGTNKVLRFGLVSTSPYSGLTISSMVQGGIALTDFTSRSNSLKTLLRHCQPDLIIVTFKDSAETITNALPEFENSVRAAAPSADVAYVTPTPSFDPFYGTTASQREAMLYYGKVFNRPVFDAFSLFNPTNGLERFYLDGVHLNAVGQAMLGSALAEWLGLDCRLFGLGFTNR